MYMFLCIHVFIFIGVELLGHRIVGSYGNSMLNIFRNRQTIFQSGSIIIHSHQFITILMSMHTYLFAAKYCIV